MLLILLQSATPLFADGKIFTEKVNSKIPYQRALILFDQGRETLVVQSLYEIPGDSGKHTLGWIVPVPAVPEVGTMSARLADQMFQDLSRYSRPEVTDLTLVTALSLGSICAAIFLFCVFSCFSKRFSDRRKFLLRIAAGAMLVFLFIGVLLPAVITQGKGGGGIEVIKSEKVGIYDAKVIRAASSKDLIDWLRANSFSFDPNDAKAFQSHIDRKWCFVTAKVDASVSPKDRAQVSSKLLAPLILTFPTDKPVYPTALTATGGHPTEILIYLASKSPMKTKAPLALRYHDSRHLTHILLQLSGIEPEDQFEHIPLDDLNYLSKFKSTLTPAEMEKDIEFEFDPGAEPFREKVFMW